MKEKWANGSLIPNFPFLPPNPKNRPTKKPQKRQITSHKPLQQSLLPHLPLFAGTIKPRSKKQSKGEQTLEGKEKKTASTSVQQPPPNHVCFYRAVSDHVVMVGCLAVVFLRFVLCPTRPHTPSLTRSLLHSLTPSLHLICAGQPVRVRAHRTLRGSQTRGLRLCCARKIRAALLDATATTITMRARLNVL